VSSEELIWWRTLAEERERELEALHVRLRRALSLLPPDQFATLAAAIDGRTGNWIHEPDRMAPRAELRPTDVLSALEDLWMRVDADGGA
jgi:hypothetical protein